MQWERLHPLSLFAPYLIDKIHSDTACHSAHCHFKLPFQTVSFATQQSWKQVSYDQEIEQMSSHKHEMVFKSRTFVLILSIYQIAKTSNSTQDNKTRAKIFFAVVLT